MTNKTLNVQGMSCGHCVNSIEESVDLKDITEVIEEQGYDVA